MSVYTSDARPEHTTTNPDATRSAVLAWLADHHDLPVRYYDGQGWHTTPGAVDRFAWHASIRGISFGDVQVTGTGPGHDSVGQPIHVSGTTAKFHSDVLFRTLLGDAVAHALDAVAPARRRGRR